MEIVRDAKADYLLADTEFGTAWERLERSTPWSTVFQDIGYLRAWHRHYRDRFETILVLERDPQGRLIFLWPLCRARGSRVLTGMGDVHAEYQCWLADPGHTERIGAALAELDRAFGGCRLAMRYLPPALSYDLGATWNARARIRAVSRAIADTSDATLAQALKSRDTRWRMNRLAGKGNVRFSVLAKDDPRLASALDALVILTDLRQYAANGLAPFRDDSAKLPFHRELLGELDLGHLSILGTDDEILSIQLNLKNRTDVVLCVLGHSPQAKRHSPGHIHLLHLVASLKEAGYPRLDLTPEGSYKERLATAHEPCAYLDVRFGTFNRFAGIIERTARSQAKRLLRRSESRGNRHAKVSGKRPIVELIQYAHTNWSARVDEMTVAHLHALIANDRTVEPALVREIMDWMGYGYRILVSTGDGWTLIVAVASGVMSVRSAHVKVTFEQALTALMGARRIGAAVDDDLCSAIQRITEYASPDDSSPPVVAVRTDRDWDEAVWTAMKRSKMTIPLRVEQESTLEGAEPKEGAGVPTYRADLPST